MEYSNFESLNVGQLVIGRSTFVGGAFAVALAIAVAIWLAQSLTRPLAQMTRAVEALSEGALIAPAVGGSHEIKVLSAAFGRMAADIWQRESLFNNTITSLADPVMVANQDGTIIIANPAARRLFGVVPGLCNVSDKRDFDAFYADGVTPLEAKDAAMSRALRGESVDNFLFVVRPRGQASEASVIASGRPVVLDRSGASNGAVTVYHDVTENMRIHAALSASERTAQAIIDTSLDAFVQFDLDGTILRWSPKAELMLGWKSDEAIGRTLRDLIIPEKSRDAHSQRIATLIQEFQSGGSGWRFGSTTLRRDGKEIVTEVSLTVQRTQNGYIINGFLRDMSGQHAAQEQLKQAQKMECVGQLTGGIAHDFNNLLTVITGTIDILSDAVDDKPHLVAITTLISKAADRAAELTANLLGFARQRPLEPQETDINALISDVCHLLEPTLGRHIEVHSMQEKDLWIARVDPSQLTAALVNLAINARDAMPDGGALTFETRNTRLEATDAVTSGLYDPGSYVLIKVSDNGAGIPDSILNKVFDPFFTTKDVGAGTGLGLSMVYGFVKQSGGHIEVSSELGRGTSFAIYLPKMRGAQGLVGPPAVDAVAVGGTETILCVEDDETVRSYVVAQLKSMGYEIIAAANAEQALAILKKGVAFDLLFTDFIMPGKMNGQQLACIAASGRPSLKVLFTSGFSGGVLDEPFESGLLLRKPYRRAELAKMVRAALNSESYFVANAVSVSGSLHS